MTHRYTFRNTVSDLGVPIYQIIDRHYSQFPERIVCVCDDLTKASKIMSALNLYDQKEESD